MAVNKEKAIAAAQKFVERGQYDKAIKEYLKVVQDDPKDVRIWLKIGDLHAKKGSAPEAIETYEKVASTYSEQGFYLKAVAVYKQILKLEPRRVEVNLRLAELYKQLGLLSDAMQQFELAANFFSKEGRTRDALEALKQIVEMEPDNVATRIKLAEGYSKEGMAQQAVAEFGRAAESLKGQNRMDDYIKVAERLLWHKPDDHALAKDLSSLYIRRQDPRRALTKLQVCFKADPRDIQTLELLADAFGALGQHQKTLSVLKEQAKVLHENGQLPQRDEVYKRILQLEPQDQEARKALGVGRRSTPPRATEFVQAIEHHPQEISATIDEEALQGALGAAPEPVAEVGSSEIEVDAVDVEASASTSDEALASRLEPAERPREARARPRTGEAPAQIGGDDAEEIGRILTETDVYIKYGLLDKAIEHLGHVFDRDPGHVQAHEKLKDLYVQTGKVGDAVDELLWLAEAAREERPEDAAQYLREALDLDPTHTDARELLHQVSLAAPAAGPVGGAPSRGRASGAPLALEDEAPEEIDAEIDAEIDDGELAAADSVMEMENVGIEVEEPPGETVEEFAEEISSAIELRPDEIEFEAEIDDRGQHGSELVPGRLTDDPSAELLSEGPRAYQGGISASALGAEPDPLEHPPPDLVRGEPAPEMLEESSGELGSLHRNGLGYGQQATEDAAVGGREGDTQHMVELEAEEPAEPEAIGLDDDLEEADFYVAQGLADQARELLGELLLRYPGHPLLTAKLREIGQADVSLSAPLTLEPPVEEDSPSDREAAGSGVLELSRRAMVEKQIGEEDFDTHYDLGIAYKEMGLFDDAIHEFKMVMKAPGREVLCHTMVGLCFSEKGMQTEAISQFKKGLYVDGITEREQLSLYFELGVSYERLDDHREALYYYEKVAKKDQRFRDVERRIGQIKQHLGGRRTGGGGNGSGNGNGAGAAGPRAEDVEKVIDGLLGQDEIET